MLIVDKFLNLFKRETPAAEPSAPSTSGGARRGGSGIDLGALLGGGGGDLNVATVFRCVNLIADSVASMPVQVLQHRRGIFEPAASSRLHYLLSVEPCPHLNAVDFWRLVVQHLLLRGNAYIVPIWAGAEIERLALVDPSSVNHDTTADTYTIADTETGVKGQFDESEIVHLKNYSRDGKKGLSTLSFARTALAITQTGDNETLNRFAHGGSVRGLVSNDTSVRGFGEYQDAELERTADDLDSRFRSGERIVSLPGQVQFNPIALSSADMQFLETRKFSVREVCRFFGVPPSFVFDDTSNNYKSAEMANVAFLSNTLNPLLRRIEVELLRKLVPAEMAHRQRIEFDRRALHACDLDSRVRYIKATIEAGLYTVNEWRREENRPPVEGGDTPFVSANLRSIADILASNAPNTPQPSTLPNDEPHD